jgi:hypothetical protein
VTDYLRKRHLSEGPVRRKLKTVGDATDEQMDQRNLRVWGIVFTTMRELVGASAQPPPRGDTRSQPAKRWHTARKAALIVCRDVYGIPTSRLAELAVTGPQEVSGWVVHPDDRTANLVSQWDQSPGPGRVARQWTELVEVTQEAAQALRTSASQGGHHPIAVASAAVLVACGALQGVSDDQLP